MLNTYLPVFVLLIVAGGFVVTMILAAIFLGPKKFSEAKDDPFECGTVGTGNPSDRLSAKFYLAAVLFILFDIEVVFLYPWVVQATALGWYGFCAVTTFLVVVAAGLVYIWRKGVLDWAR